MRKFRILFVDDELKRMRKWIEAMEAAGYEVVGAASEAEARSTLSDGTQFDLAVLDLILRPKLVGDTSGLNLARVIQGAFPVIMLTGSSDLVSALRALNQLRNASAVHKLEGPDALIEKIKMALVKLGPDLGDVLRALRKGADGRSLVARALHKTEGSDVLIEEIRKSLVHHVFVSHGHDPVAKREVVLCLKALGVQPLVLQDKPSKGIAIAEAIEQYSNVSFAVILLTADDVGGRAARPKIQRPRARQNVIWEWGFFIGRLGRDRVAVLRKGGKPGPIDLPSNYDGVRYIDMDATANGAANSLRGSAMSGSPLMQLIFRRRFDEPAVFLVEA